MMARTAIGSRTSSLIKRAEPVVANVGVVAPAAGFLAAAGVAFGETAV
jgi:hypothetical protein